MTKKIILSVAMPIALWGSVAASSSESATRIYLSVYNMDSWRDISDAETGIYSFSKTTYDPQAVKIDCNLDASGGGVMTEDYYFCTSELNYGFGPEINHYFFKRGNWEQLSGIFGSESGVATDLAYDHTTGKIYGCFQTDADKGEEPGKFVFGSINETTGERLKIAELTVPWIALGCNRQGELYAVAADGELLKVAKNGVITELGNLGFTATNRSTGTIDTATGVFYVVATNSATSTSGVGKTVSDLYSVDIEKISAERIYNFAGGEAVGGMWIPGPLAADDAPTMAEEFSVAFPEGALTGKVSFRVPCVTFSGSPLEKEVSYLVKGNGSLLAQGKASAGEVVDLDCSISTAGMYEISCELRNAAGRSERAFAELWIGHDLPNPIEKLTTVYRDGTFHLDWTQPEGSRHGGFVNPALTSYQITRLPDGEIVATSLTATQYDDAVEIPSSLISYRYKVAQFYDGEKIAELSGDTYRLGSVALPYSLDFEDESSFDELTIIDANGDKAEWYREEYWYIEAEDLECAAAVYPYSSVNDADDWLILPPVRLESDKDYSLSFEVSTVSDSYPETLEVCYGEQPEAAQLTNVIMAPSVYESYEPKLEQLTLSGATTGIYYIGIHAISAADGAGIGIRNILLKEVEGSGAREVGADSNVGQKRYYNLQGIRVPCRPTSGMYIEVDSEGRVKN